MTSRLGRRRIRNGAAAALAIAIALFGVAEHAAAHALLVEAIPAEAATLETAPPQLVLRFNSRIDHARGYIAPLAHARFVVADYARFDEPADVVTMFYPFVTVAPLLAWRLPLKVFAPEAWFARAARNLARGGVLVVVSHGADEAAIAVRHCRAAGFAALAQFCDEAPLLPRPLPSVVTLWRR